MSPPKVRFLTKIYHPNIGELDRHAVSMPRCEGVALLFPVYSHNARRRLVPLVIGML